MTTNEQIKQLVIRSGRYPVREKSKTDTEYRTKLANINKLIDKLVKVNNAYDFIFDNFILGCPREQKLHFLVVEDLLNKECTRTREKLFKDK